MTAPHPAASRPRRLLTVVGLIIPLVIVVASLIVMLVALPSLPAEVITHWGPSGDQTGPAWTYPLITALTGLGIPLLLWATGVRRRRASDAAVLLASVALAIAAMLAVIMPWALIVQPPGASAAVPFIIGTAIAIALGAGAWFVLPRDPALPPSASLVEPIAQPSGARTVWTTIARMPAAARIGIAAGILASAVVVVITIVAGGSTGWWLVILPIVLTVAFATTTEFRATAGPTGLLVRAALGWPVFRVPAADIERVEVTTVDPMAEFGGWGLRLGLARNGSRRAFGIILRRGEAIDVLRRDGRRLVVTVDDAATGASVLAAASRDAAVIG